MCVCVCFIHSPPSNAEASRLSRFFYLNERCAVDLSRRGTLDSQTTRRHRCEKQTVFTSVETLSQLGIELLCWWCLGTECVVMWRWQCSGRLTTDFSKVLRSFETLATTLPTISVTCYLLRHRLENLECRIWKSAAQNIALSASCKSVRRSRTCVSLRTVSACLCPDCGLVFIFSRCVVNGVSAASMWETWRQMQYSLDVRDLFGPIKPSRTSESMFSLKRLFSSKNWRAVTSNRNKGISQILKFIFNSNKNQYLYTGVT
jgi:hypothetical protein